MRNKISAVVILFCLTLGLFSCSKRQEKVENPPLDPLGSDGVATILLDAGHGFGDVGCTSEYLDGLYEYELTMDFTMRLAKKLEDMGYKVLLTHDGESYISEEEICLRADEKDIEYMPDKMSVGNNVFDAYERAVYANVLDAEVEIDFMLSVHVNANADTNTAQGFEIDYCADNESSEMSAFVFDSICDALERDFSGRRLKKFADSWEMAFIVTKYTSMPSILFETGFASTPSDAELLLDENWRDKLMTTISEGIDDYFASGGLVPPAA